MSDDIDRGEQWIADWIAGERTADTPANRDRLAAPEQIVAAMGVLIGSYPQRKGDTRTFDHLLCTDVSDQTLSVYELYQLGIRLRRRYKFFPSIAEVLDEVNAMSGL
jgi:hypothetical protein